jgi:hypothetical protein
MLARVRLMSIVAFFQLETLHYDWLYGTDRREKDNQKIYSKQPLRQNAVARTK